MTLPPKNQFVGRTGREDAWRRQVEPRDHTWAERPREVVFCDLCSVCHPADPERKKATGRWICEACVERHQ